MPGRIPQYAIARDEITLEMLELIVDQGAISLSPPIELGPGMQCAPKFSRVTKELRQFFSGGGINRYKVDHHASVSVRRHVHRQLYFGFRLA